MEKQEEAPAPEEEMLPEPKEIFVYSAQRFASFHFENVHSVPIDFSEIHSGGKEENVQSLPFTFLAFSEAVLVFWVLISSPLR